MPRSGPPGPGARMGGPGVGGGAPLPPGPPPPPPQGMAPMAHNASMPATMMKAFMAATMGRGAAAGGAGIPPRGGGAGSGAQRPPQMRGGSGGGGGMGARGGGGAQGHQPGGAGGGGAPGKDAGPFPLHARNTRAHTHEPAYTHTHTDILTLHVCHTRVRLAHRICFFYYLFLGRNFFGRIWSEEFFSGTRAISLPHMSGTCFFLFDSSS